MRRKGKSSRGTVLAQTPRQADAASELAQNGLQRQQAAGEAWVPRQRKSWKLSQRKDDLPTGLQERCNNKKGRLRDACTRLPQAVLAGLSRPE